MILTKQCACGQKVEFEAEDLPQLNCPHCGQSLQAQFAPKTPRVPKPDLETATATAPAPLSHKPASVTSSETPTLNTLKRIREQSCYKALRGVIDVVIGVGLALAICTVAASLAQLIEHPDFRGATLAGTIAIPAAFVVVILIALKQGLLLAIDAVDTMIADRTDRQAEARALLAEKQARRQNAFEEFQTQTGK